MAVGDAIVGVHDDLELGGNGNRDADNALEGDPRAFIIKEGENG
jgi:hypothetical protein